MGAGTFNTIDNDKFVFDEPGVYTLLHIPKTLSNPEVRIQVRLERYPNRKVDFSMFDIPSTFSYCEIERLHEKSEPLLGNHESYSLSFKWT